MSRILLHVTLRTNIVSQNYASQLEQLTKFIINSFDTD